MCGTDILNTIDTQNTINTQNDVITDILNTINTQYGYTKWCNFLLHHKLIHNIILLKHNRIKKISDTKRRVRRADSTRRK